MFYNNYLGPGNYYGVPQTPVQPPVGVFNQQPYQFAPFKAESAAPAAAAYVTKEEFDALAKKVDEMSAKPAE